jgi:hypothetical protein
MRFKTGLIFGLGAGYVLGAKAGKERYEQIVEATRAFLDNPGVQRLTDEVGKTVNVGKERLSSATSAKVEQVSSSLADQANKAKGLVGGESKTDAPKTGDEAKAATSPAPAAKASGEESPAGTSPAGATRSGRPS